MITCPQLGRSGRLGNQLWQIASTLGIADTLSEDVRFPRWDYEHQFHVDKAKFTDEAGTPADTTSLVNHIDPRARVYLQDYGLWKHIEGKVRDWLRPSVAAMRHLQQYKDFWNLPEPILSIHVRRGDNAYDPETPDKHLYHPLRPMSYYEQAIEDLAPDARSIAVFSDDPEWCEQNFKDVYVHHGTPRAKEHQPEYKTEPVRDWIDVFLMSFCQYHIISNSTYSWWGAFLSRDTVPVYPWPWFGPKLDHIDASLMFPATWRRLTHVV